jgi:hypothetical protein
MRLLPAARPQPAATFFDCSCPGVVSGESSALDSTEPKLTSRQVEGVVLVGAQASPGIPTRGCSDLPVGAERKLQPAAASAGVAQCSESLAASV